MKNVLIYAYTKLNLGDDLFIKILCERYPNTNFFLLANGYKEKFKDIENLTCYNYDFLLVRIINKLLSILGINNIQLPKIREKLTLKKVDACVYIGGSLFIESDDWKKDLESLRQKINKSKEFYIIGCNFGPYKSDEYLKEYKDLFSKCKDVCFRDEYSFNLFKDLKNVRKADDIVFGYDIKSNTRKNQISISVMDLKNRKNLTEYNECYLNKMVQLCKFSIDNGNKVKLISFCREEGDEDAINNIIDLLDGRYRNKVEIINYNGDLNKPINELSSSKLIVACRFHSMILGFNSGNSVYPIIYSDKMKNVLDDIGFEGGYSTIQDLKDTPIEDIYNSINSNSIDINSQIKKSNMHFYELDKALGNQLSTNQI